MADLKHSGLNYKKALVINEETGKVDAELTLNRIENELADFFVELAKDNVATDALRTAVDGVFAALPDAEVKTIPIDSVATRAMMALETAVGQEGGVAKQVKGFLRSESEKFVASNGAEGLYLVRLGPNGGVSQSSPALVKRHIETLAKAAAK